MSPKRTGPPTRQGRRPQKCLAVESPDTTAPRSRPQEPASALGFDALARLAPHIGLTRVACLACAGDHTGAGAKKKCLTLWRKPGDFISFACKRCDQGGFVRFYEVPEIVRAAAPVYVKLGLRNAPSIYPVGLHLADTATKLARERVRRAELVLRLLRERAPDLRGGRGDDRPGDLAIPEPA